MLRPRLSLTPLVALLASSILFATSGCYFTRSPSRPVPALAFRHPSIERPRCLVVMLPGFLDGPDSYREHAFPRRIVASGAPCDSVAVDLHYRYYGERDIARIVHDDVLVPARARGYDEIWLVGISMGGLGALMTARSYADELAGLILLAPFVGDERTLHAIEAAGGVAAWSAPVPMPPLDADHYTEHLWSWLRGYVDDPDAMPPLYVGWGENDRLGASDRLLASVLPADHVVVGGGRHDWASWQPIFDAILRVAPVGRLDEAR